MFSVVWSKKEKMLPIIALSLLVFYIVTCPIIAMVQTGMIKEYTVDAVIYWFDKILYFMPVVCVLSGIPIIVICIFSFFKKKFRPLYLFIIMLVIASLLIPNITYATLYYWVLNIPISDESNYMSIYFIFFWVNIILTIIVACLVYFLNLYNSRILSKFNYKELVFLWIIIIIVINLIMPIGIVPN